MGTPKRIPEARKNSAGATVGLLANGSSGPWQVDIDESVGEGDKVFAQIEGPAIYLYFEVPSLQYIGAALQFLRREPSSIRETSLLRIGTFGRAAVNLMWDDEFADRCFLVVGASGKPSVRLTLSGEEIQHLSEALKQVQEDLAIPAPLAPGK